MAVARWLRDGAPMGIKVPIEESGGAFPKCRSARTRTPAEALQLPPVDNHRSFKEAGEFTSPPGHDIVAQHVNQGFSDASAARLCL